MPRTFTRSSRVAAQIQRELAVILQMDVRDPRFAFVTVNDVRVSRDMSVAKIFVSMLPEEGVDAKQSFLALNHAAPFIRTKLASRLLMRSIPELRFIEDEALERARRLDALFDADKPESPG